MDKTRNTDSGPSTSNSGTPQSVFIEPQYPSHNYIPNDQLDSFLEGETTSIDIPIEFVKCFTQRIVEKSNKLSISKDIQYEGPYYGTVSITLPNSEKPRTDKRHRIDDIDSDKIPPNPRHYLGNYSATNLMKVLPPPKEDLVPEGKFWHFDDKQTIQFDTGNVSEKEFFSHINQMHKHRKEDSERVVFRVVSRLQPNTGASVITSYKVSALELMRRLTWPEFMCNAAVARVVKKEKKVDNFISTLKDICPKLSKTLRCPYPRYSAWSNFSEQEANKFAIDTGEILDAMPIKTINPGTDNIYEAIKQFEQNLRDCLLFDRLTHTAGPPLIECIMHTFKKFLLPCFPDAETELTLSQSQPDTDTDKYDDIDQSDEEQAQKLKQSRYRRKKSTSTNEDEVSLAQHGRKMVVVPKGRSKSAKSQVEGTISRPRTKTTKRKEIAPTSGSFRNQSSTEEDTISVSSDSTPTPSDNEKDDPNYIEEVHVTDNNQDSTSPIETSKPPEKSSEKKTDSNTKFRKQFVQRFQDQFHQAERDKKAREKEPGNKPTKKGRQTCSTHLSRKQANKKNLIEKLHKIAEDSSPGEDSGQKEKTSDKEQAIKKSNIQNLNVFDLIGKYRSETSESDRNQIKHLAGLLNKIVHDDKNLESGQSKTPTKETTNTMKSKRKLRIPLRHFVPLSVSSDTNSSPMFLSTSTESDLSGVGNPSSTASIPDDKHAPDSSFDKETDKELYNTNPDETELDIGKVKTEPCSDTEEERKRIVSGFEYRNGKKYLCVLESVQDNIEDDEVMIVDYYKVSPPKFDMSKIKAEKDDSGNGPKPPGSSSERKSQDESEHTSHEYEPNERLPEKKDTEQLGKQGTPTKRAHDTHDIEQSTSKKLEISPPEVSGSAKDDKQQGGQQGTSTKRGHGTHDSDQNTSKKMKISPPELSCSSPVPLQRNDEASYTAKKCGIENNTSDLEVVEHDHPRDNKDMGSAQEEQVTVSAQESQNRLQQLAKLVDESAITPPVSPPLEFTPLSSVEEAASHHIDVVGIGPDGTGTMPLKYFAPILQGLDDSQDSQDSVNRHENPINPPSCTEPDYMTDDMLLAAVEDSNAVEHGVVSFSPRSIGQKQEPVNQSEVMLQLVQANGEVINVVGSEKERNTLEKPEVQLKLEIGIDQSKKVESTENVDTEVGPKTKIGKELNPDHAVDSSTEFNQNSTNQKQTCADVHNEGSEEKEKRDVIGTELFASVEFNCPIVENDTKEKQQVKCSSLARDKPTESMQLRSNKSGPSRSLGVRPSRNRTKKKEADYLYN